MNKKIPLLVTLVGIAACLLLFPDPAVAGPGGEIASALFRTLPGKILMGVLIIIFSPFIVYIIIKEHIAVRKTLQDLRMLAARHEEFDWLQLKERVIESFQRVHSAWRKEDMAEASQWMTDWYWQNQQLVFLNQWEQDGLVNHCRVRSIKSVRPLFVRYKDDNGVLDGSRVIVSITADMEDYLAERASGKVVQGAKGYSEVETVWTFVYEKTRWLVCSIEQGAVSLQYAQLLNEVPQIAKLPGEYQSR